MLDFGGPPASSIPPSMTNPYGQKSAVPAANLYGAAAVSSDPWGGGSSYPGSEYPALTAPPVPAQGYAARIESFSSLPPNNASTRADSFTSLPAAGGNPYAENSFGGGQNVGSGASNPFATQPVPASGALVATGPSNPYSQMSNPYASSTQAQSNPYGPPVATGTNPYAPQSDSAAGSFSSSVPSASNPFGISSTPGNPYSAPSNFVPPPPVSTNFYGDNSIPPAVTPKPQQTPSTLGFGSPADFNFSSPMPCNILGPEEGLPQHDQALSMNALADHNERASANTPADGLNQAFSKLVNLDTFSLSSKKDERRSNPFESNSNDIVGGSRSLADIQKTKVRFP